MQPPIGPPIYISIHLVANASGWMRISVMAIIAVSLVVYIVFLVWCHSFLRRWSRELDEKKRQREERERESESEQRHADSMKQLRALIERTAGNR